MKFTKRTMIGLDAGSLKSGIVVIDENGIREGYNIPNEFVFAFITTEQKKCDSIMVVIEDIKPYNMRITDGIIQTIKFLGEIEYRLKTAAIHFELIPRWEVKQWVYDKFTPMVQIEIGKNIVRLDNREKKKDGEGYVPKNRSVTFVYVDDAMVVKAMREVWKVERPTGFAQKAKYNLKDHSWQALATCTVYMAKSKTFLNMLSLPLKSDSF